MYSIRMVLHFKELKLLETYINIMIKELLFLLLNKLWIISFVLMLRNFIFLCVVHSSLACKAINNNVPHNINDETMEDKSHNLTKSSTYALTIEYELTHTWNFKTNTWTHLRHSNLRRFLKVSSIENGWVKRFWILLLFYHDQWFNK